MKKLLKPNVLERTPEQRGIKEKHSPWTAPRDKKKKRSTYDHSLPDVDECNQPNQHGKDPQRQQDLKPRFIALNLDVLSHDGMRGAFPSRSAAEPTHGGNLPGGWAQGFSLLKDASSSAQTVQLDSVAPHGASNERSAGAHARRPSSAGGLLETLSSSRVQEAAAAQRGFVCDPFKVLQAGASDAQHCEERCSSSDRCAEGGAREQQGTRGHGEMKAHSCDFPTAGGPPVDPLMPDSCSTDFASVAARRPAFQAAFYFGARRRSDPDMEPFGFSEHGPLAAGAQRFSTSLPNAHLPRDSTTASSGPAHGKCTPSQDAQRPDTRGPFAESAQRARLAGSGEAGAAAEAMEVCSGGGTDVGTPQARHAQLLWPASLQRLRRGGRRSPASPPLQADGGEPDMQPLGRHISGVHPADGCDTPDAACRPSQPCAGKAQPARAFASENDPGRANHAVTRMATEGTPYAEDGGRARGRARGCGGRGPALQEQQQPRLIQRSALMEVSRAGHGVLQSGGNAWQAVACSPMQMDVQPTRLGRLHAVMEMSTLDASLDGTRFSGSVTQLEVQRDGVGGSTAQVMQWQMAMQRDEPCHSSCTSSAGGSEPRPIVSPCSSTDSRELSVRRTKLSGLLMSGDVASPASVVMISGDALAETFSPFAVGTPGPGAIDEEDFKCSQASNGDLAPMKLPGSATVKDAVSDGKLATFNDRLHEAVVNGDVDLVGQAWQQVHTGDVQPDIDTLNALLKSFCRVKGDPSPKEAEQLVAAAMKHGCQPNAATYHHLTDIGMRHEMMACADEKPDERERDPFVTPLGSGFPQAGSA